MLNQTSHSIFYKGVIVMSSSIDQFRRSELFKPAIMVPAMIMLIFSLFNLTAPADPVRTASAFNLGVVNQDEGLTFPPMKLATFAMDGISGNLPFTVTELDNPEIARSALEAGEVATVIIFPADFSKLAVGDKNFSIEIWNTQHLTVAETQMASQLPMMVQMALSSGVANLRLAMSKGQMPSLDLTVTADVETLHRAENTAILPAPFVMTFTSWLAAMVGTILLFLATSQMASMNRAYVRTLVPVMTMGLASFVLALVVIFTTSQWGLFIGIWLNVWLVSLCLVWLFMGIFELMGLWSLLVILPTVFYQSVLGGSMAPVAAAPDWLREIGEVIPFDLIGSAYRGVMYDAGGGLPFIWLLSAALIGIILIWGSAIVKDR